MDANRCIKILKINNYYKILFVNALVKSKKIHFLDYFLIKFVNNYLSLIHYWHICGRLFLLIRRSTETAI